VDLPLRIAVIGSGISGMTAAALLHRRHDVTVLEANGYIGGHTHTVSVNLDGERHAIDTGFIVFNERTYPNFTRFLNLLGVASRPTSMSFSVRCSRSGLEYNGTSLNGLFSQRSNLLRPGFHRMIADILRFNREAQQLLQNLDHEVRVDEFLRRHGYSRQFAEHYLLPMGAAIWSCPVEAFGAFPVRFIIEFYANHGLLQVHDRPVWRVVEGGSHRYVEKLTAPFHDRIHLHCPVASVRRTADGVLVESRRGSELYDEVIFACHSDQALRLLGDADETERSLLSEFPYSRNRAVLHTDTSLLPRRRRAWASWNYHIPAAGADRPTVTYYMNLLQGLASQHTFCVTLNEEQAIDPSKVLGAWNYSHPVFTIRRTAAQQRHLEVIRRRRTSFCGAYWGNGFHEDGVNSALRVCEAFGIDRQTWDRAMSGPAAARPRVSLKAEELGHAAQT
jgi:uncharacterized protein